MRKYFVLAVVMGALIAPISVSTAMAEEEHFIKKQSEGIQKWLETSRQTKQTMDSQNKAMYDHQAALNQENNKIKERLVDYQMKSHKSTQGNAIPNQWYNLYDINE